MRQEIYWKDKEFSARLVQKECEKEAVYRLRYRAYVRERKVKLEYADHKKQCVVEPVDDLSALMGVFDRNDQIIATTRMTLSRSCPRQEIPYFPDYFEYAKVSAPGRYALVTKLVVDQDYRGSTATLGVCKASYVYLHRQNLDMLFIDVGDFTVPFMKRLGFQPYKGYAEHPDFGRSLPMFMRMDSDKYMHCSKKAK